MEIRNYGIKKVSVGYKLRAISLSTLWKTLLANTFNLRFGIDVFGYSADGDPRLLSSMRSRVKLNLGELNEKSFEIFFNSADGRIYIQDTIHIPTKLRNRMLKASIMLPMGSYQVSVSHIKMLLSLVAKEEHGLVMSDIHPEDRQNFAAFEKITQQRVIASLKKSIIGSEATIMYLNICGKISSSFLDNTISPTERIYRIWYYVYYLRAWRKWLQQTEYKVNDHFISPNSYTCIEINAHGLIYAIQLLREKNESSMFLPELMSSQQCEYTFRKLRSMSTANYTRINFSLFELLHLVSRVELMNDIIYSRMNLPSPDLGPDTSPDTSRVFFPRVEKSTNAVEANVDLPSNKEILNVMKTAQSDALNDANKIGMDIKAIDVSTCALLQSNAKMAADLAADSESDMSQDEFFDEFDENIENDLLEDDGTSSHSKYIEVKNEDGSSKNIRKSTFLWMLSESKGKLSSDRLKRVQEGKEEKSKRRRIDVAAPRI